MSYDFTGKLIDFLYIIVPTAIILALIILYERSLKKDLKKSEDEK